MAVIHETWSGGMSTRKGDELVQALGMAGINQSQVSELYGTLDERVDDFLERPLTEEYRYVWLDATSLQVRQGGWVVSVAAMALEPAGHGGSGVPRPAAAFRPGEPAGLVGPNVTATPAPGGG